MATITFPSDSSPYTAASLPSSNVVSGASIGWYNSQRKILQKLAQQYLPVESKAVEVMASQGQPDTSDPGVVATRAGFTELRTRLPVLNQYYRYTGSHGGTFDEVYLTKIKDLVLSWVRTNVPTGKPIDETNFENLLRVIGDRWADFSGAEQTDITAWLNALKTAKEAWDFDAAAGEGKLIYGNHYTHHYKILLKVYQLLGVSTTTLISDINAFAVNNLPFGNGAIIHPAEFTITGVNQASKKFTVVGNQTSSFFTTYLSKVYVNGSTGNDGWYSFVSAVFTGGNTEITVTEDIPSATVDGKIVGSYNDTTHDMSRPAIAAGESIDMIRRDALHYQQYDLEPWIELALLSPGNFTTTVDNLWSYLLTWALSPPRKRYEFFATSDTFDMLRYNISHPQYLQPTAMYWPDDMARCALAYDYLKRYPTTALTSNLDEKVLAPVAFRGDNRPTVQYYFFRWVFLGLYG